MKERLIAGLLACGALALFWALLLPKPPQSAREVARPLSYETHAEGYAALSRWLEAERFKVVKLRQRFGELAGGLSLAQPDGNLLIVSFPGAEAISDREVDALEQWIRSGNTLLLIAALDDTPPWAGAFDGSVQARLRRLARVDVLPVEQQGATLADALQPDAPELQPTPWHPVARDVAVIATRADLPATQWRVEAMDNAPVLVLARRADTQRPAVWARPFGAGTIILSAWASPFANSQIGLRDNARFISGLVGWSLRKGGTVIFDDMHQGASDYYDPRKFFADPRLHHTLWWVVALWFAYVLGMRPLLAAAPARARLDDTSMLNVTAGFLAHVLKPADAARRLFALFFNDLRHRLALPENGAPLWDWLAGQARLDPAQVARLRELHARAERGQRVDLIRLRNSLLEITGRLS